MSAHPYAPPVVASASSTPTLGVPPPSAAGRPSGLTVGRKLALGIGLLGAGVVLMGALTWITGQATIDRARFLADEQLPLERDVRSWKTQAVLLGELAIRASSATDVFPVADEIRKQSLVEDRLVDDAVRHIRGASTAAEAAPLLDAATAQRSAYLTQRTRLVADALEAKVISQKQIADHTDALRSYLGGLDRLLEQSADASRDAATTMVAGALRAQRVGAAAALVVIIGALTAGLLLRRSIVAPLADASQAAARVAQGDLTVQLDTRRGDEIGALLRALDAMVGGLHQVVAEVQQAGGAIHVASSEVAAGNLDLSHRTEETASSLQQTASGMEQLGSMVAHNADSARQADGLAAAASAAAARGGDVVREAVRTMATIDDSSRRIGEIVGLIDGIAFQTNILALNAAVEAARAGEQGRGFAVVAGEVRTLAQRSSTAAREIRQLIHASLDKVQAGTGQVRHVGEAMDAIVAEVSRVAAVVGEIARATDDQRREIAEVTQAVHDVDRMTQQNAALVEQGSAAADSLKDQAARLARSVGVFRLRSA